MIFSTTIPVAQKDYIGCKKTGTLKKTLSMTVSKPFRTYNSLRDINSGFSDLAILFGKGRVKDLIQYTKPSNKSAEPHIEKPPMLSRLPEVMVLELNIIKRTTETIREEFYAMLAGLDPVPDFDQILKHLCFEGMQKVICSPERILETVEKVTGRKYEDGVFGLEFYWAIKRQIYRFMKNGQTSIPLHELKHAIVLYTILQPGNDDVRHGILHSAPASATEALFQNSLTELLFSRLRLFMLSVSYLDISKLCQTIKHKIQKLDLRPGVKAILSHDLNSVTSISGYEELVIHKVPEKIKKLGIGGQTAAKIEHILKSGISGTNRLSSLYEKWFLSPGLAPYQKVYVPKRIGKVTIHFRPVETTKKQTLSLYPCKDLLELMKGDISRDCTSGISLARSHLQTKEFFNIRIYSGKSWVGNIYCLDLSEKHNCCIIDKIQIPNRHIEQWAGFFPALKRSLATAFGKVMVLAPSAISNSSDVREGFSSFKKALSSKRYVKDSFPEMEHLGSFECSWSKRFLVFCEAGEPEVLPLLLNENTAGG